jgi:hypothetical protein
MEQFLIWTPQSRFKISKNENVKPWGLAFSLWEVGYKV